MKVRLQSVGIVRAGEATQLQVTVALVPGLVAGEEPIATQAFQYGEAVTKQQIWDNVKVWAKQFASIKQKVDSLQGMVGTEVDIGG